MLKNANGHYSGHAQGKGRGGGRGGEGFRKHWANLVRSGKAGQVKMTVIALDSAMHMQRGYSGVFHATKRSWCCRKLHAKQDTKTPFPLPLFGNNIFSFKRKFPTT